MTTHTYVWKDRKRIIFGLPWTFTVYKLTKEKLLVETGFLSKREEEVRLYRIMDLTLERPLGQRIWGLGTIHCCTADRSTPEFDILRIKNNTHSVMVMKVVGNNFIVAEGNYNRSIHWGRVITRSEAKNGGTYVMTRR